MFKSDCAAHGHALIQVLRDGVEIARREGRNTVVNTGKALLANRCFSDGDQAAIQYMQLGLGGTAANSSQTNLLTESATPAGRQTVGTVGMSGTRTAKFEKTFTASEFSAAGLREVGLFNNALTSAGTMFARFTFTTEQQAVA